MASPDFNSKLDRIKKSSTKTKKISSEDYNTIVSSLKSLSARGTDSPGTMVIDSDGIHSSNPVVEFERFFGILVDVGPDGEDNYDDWRYWFREVVPNPEFDPHQDVTLWAGWEDTTWPMSLIENGRWDTCINISESSISMPRASSAETGTYKIGTHGLEIISSDINLMPPTVHEEVVSEGTNNGERPLNGMKAWLSSTSSYDINNNGENTQTFFELPTIVQITRYGKLYMIDRHPQKLVPKWDIIVQTVTEDGCPCKWQWVMTVGGNPVKMYTVDNMPPISDEETQLCTDGYGVNQE